MLKKQSVLIIDNEKQIRKILVRCLEAEDFIAIESDSGNDGLKKAADLNPDAIILDFKLKDDEGLNILNKLRYWYKSPILILSSSNNEIDIINSLDSGANDYIIKPFSTGEFMARLRAAIRNNHDLESLSILKNGNLSIDLKNKTVKKNNQVLKLTLTEYSILWVFFQNINKVISYKYLLEKIWGENFQRENQYLRVYISQLRKKIEDDPANPKMILTESGMGYRFSLIN